MKKVLLVIDIQRKYEANFSLNYLLKVGDFLNKKASNFDEVSCIMDICNTTNKGDFIPSFIFNRLSDLPLFKQYSEKYTVDMINATGIIEMKKSDNGYQILTSEKSLVEQDKYIKKVENGAIISMKENSNKIIEYIDSNYLNIIERWHLEKAKIYLIGGGLEKCVKKTKNILETFGLKVKVLEEYCYDIKNENLINKIVRKFIPFKMPVEVIEWSFIPNTNNQLIEYVEKQKEAKNLCY